MISPAWIQHELGINSAHKFGMDIETGLSIVDTVLGSKGLNNVQEFVFRQSWQNRNYVKMAAETHYDETLSEIHWL